LTPLYGENDSGNKVITSYTPVTVAVVKKQKMTIELESIGSLRSMKSPLLLYPFLKPGYVEKVYVSAGNKVKKGEPLIQLKSGFLHAYLATKKSHLEAIRAKRVLAESEARMYGALYKKHGVSELSYQTKKENFRYLSLRVKAAEIGLAYAQEQMNEATVRSPINGFVVEVFVKEGSSVKPSGRLIKLSNSEKLYATLAFQLAPQIKSSVDILLS